MGLISKRDPIGIDYVVDVIQSGLYTELCKVWTGYQSYPRSYKNPDGNNTIPEHYVGENEYVEVLLDDNHSVSSFFLTSDSRSADNFVFEQSVSVIFQADLKELYPNITHRADEEMHKDITNAVESINQDESLVDLVTGVNNVYSELNLVGRLKELVKMDDMSNLHVVKISLLVHYSICGDDTDLL